MAVSDTKADMKQFMNRGDFSFPVMLCPDEVAMAYGVQYIPAVFVLDGHGRIAATPDGIVTAAELSKIVDGLAD